MLRSTLDKLAKLVASLWDSFLVFSSKETEVSHLKWPPWGGARSRRANCRGRRPNGAAQPPRIPPAQPCARLPGKLGPPARRPPPVPTLCAVWNTKQQIINICSKKPIELQISFLHFKAISVIVFSFPYNSCQQWIECLEQIDIFVGLFADTESSQSLLDQMRNFTIHGHYNKEHNPCWTSKTKEFLSHISISRSSSSLPSENWVAA